MVLRGGKLARAIALTLAFGRRLAGLAHGVGPLPNRDGNAAYAAALGLASRRRCNPRVAPAGCNEGWSCQRSCAELRYNGTAASAARGELQGLGTGPAADCFGGCAPWGRKVAREALALGPRTLCDTDFPAAEQAMLTRDLCGGSAGHAGALGLD